MMKRSAPSMSLCVLGLFVVCAFFFGTAAYAAGQIRVTLREKVTIEKDVVRLRELADVSGMPESAASSLAMAEVATSPLPGQSRFVSLDYIRIRLRNAGFDTDTIHFLGTQDVQISRAAATVPREAIIRAVEAAIRRQMPWKRESVEISNVRFDDDMALPTGILTYRIVPNRNEDYLGRTMLALHLFVDGEKVKKTWVHADIAVMADVVKVVRPLGRHQRIQRTDLSVVRADLSDLPSDTVRSIQDAVGNRTTQMIYPDTLLKTGMFSLPPLVNRGDIVKIVANAGPMTITATGKVKQRGCKGELIDVINTDSQRVITARVIGPGAVEVDF